MKYIFAISMLFLSSAIFAQGNTQQDTTVSKKIIPPATQLPLNVSNIPVTPEVTTTLTTQPLAIPNSNANPVTGTVISGSGNKNTLKAINPLGTATLNTKPVVTKGDTTLNNSRTISTAPKTVNKKTKVGSKQGKQKLSLE